MADVRTYVAFNGFPKLDGGNNLLGQLTRLIEFDTKPYVKHDTGDTEESADSSDFSSGVIVYSATDRKGRQYAGYAYEDPAVAETDKKPKATDHWFEKAQLDRLEDWMRFVAEAVAKGGTE
jgi:hypothetical protein